MQGSDFYKTENGTDLDVQGYPTENSWTFVSSTADLTKYCGKTIYIGFLYSSSPTGAPTWEVKNFAACLDNRYSILCCSFEPTTIGTQVDCTIKQGSSTHDIWHRFQINIGWERPFSTIAGITLYEYFYFVDN